MSFVSEGPGKTAPRLFHDFLTFDPLKVNGRNLLRTFPPHVGEGQDLPPNPQIGACGHNYTLKYSQSILPPRDYRPDSQTVFKAALICKRCRLHADLRISYRASTNPCPNADHPVHHFQALPGLDTSTHNRIQYGWQCSASGCRAQVLTIFRLPRLSDGERNLIATPEFLKRRYEEALAAGPERDIKEATPMQALHRVRTYLRDALNPEHTQRTIAEDQKKFIEVFGMHGQESVGLLKKLGFTYSDHSWELPDPPELDEDDRLVANGDSAREALEDVHAELLAWMHKLNAETGVVNLAAAEGWAVADLEVKRVLAAHDYALYVPFRRPSTMNPELQYYIASLGAMADFGDAMIDFAYERQSMCDPPNRPYYFECLQVVAESRGTEKLQLKVAMLASQDLVSRRDLSAAYRLLNVPVHDAHNYDDVRILDQFHVRQSDLGVQAQEDARQALYRIGMARGSTRLINASRQLVETYDDALTWIGNGVNRETTDESLLAVVGMKILDDKANEEIAQKAITVIAKERGSKQLQNWVATGRTETFDMSADEALRILGIEDNFSAIDQTLLPTLFDSVRSDRPGGQTEQAIAVLQKAIEGNGSTTRDPATWPVGLRSHGNTCYLNSLLQYYFSITPLRDIILDYQQYALDTTKFKEKEERVGHRKISIVEIKGGQKFADDLKKLFENMIKESGDSVMPEEALVCRAFLEPKDYELLAPDAPKEVKPAQEDSTIVADEMISDYVTVTAPTENDKGHESDASSTTLQGSPEGDGNTTTKPPQDLLTPPGSPAIDAMDVQPEPERAPPLPPRLPSNTKDEALSRAQSNARQQQDVTEVHDGAMFRLRSGMMPLGKDESDEQYDNLRSLFSIALAETPVRNGAEGPKKVLLDSSLQLNVPNESKNIYSALDEIFDLQAYDENASLETYKSITKMPPLLQINIPRIGYDNVRGAFKSNACIKLEEELYLDRYVESADPEVLALRKKCWGWRKQLHNLKKEKSVLSKTSTNLDGPDTVTRTAEYLNNISSSLNAELAALDLDGIDVDPTLPSALASDAEAQRTRLLQLDQEISRLDTSISPLSFPQTLKYRLAAVFFHRGDYGHGHYWIYIYDFAQKLWRKYNDERVEEFPQDKISKILAANEWSHGTPTYAVYVSDDLAEEVIQPVCRKPEGVVAAPSAPVDEVMADDGKDGSAAGMRPRSDSTLAVDDAGNLRDAVTESSGPWDQKREVSKSEW
ncbi:cysteine proteinase [Dissoconium aciculare CBS 342.82]|uniref:ubiquitinyl hydrolase 1 n=1 Tax=Dissoconium aciculare CBS 342.82 TaxID=1314786 RepID=A0A6J3LSK4_9PEZI|nr:cysteine proteinase [Dissoconium aciculare CBS 342.82]KAF1818761.1 cysteine proteinase [Dissoconium aciculare CBS 342.82]